jgi:hypothetical protein
VTHCSHVGVVLLTTRTNIANQKTVLPRLLGAVLAKSLRAREELVDAILFIFGESTVDARAKVR